jgi:hypothetical protein
VSASFELDDDPAKDPRDLHRSDCSFRPLLPEVKVTAAG